MQVQSVTKTILVTKENQLNTTANIMSMIVNKCISAALYNSSDAVVWYTHKARATYAIAIWSIVGLLKH